MKYLQMFKSIILRIVIEKSIQLKYAGCPSMLQILVYTLYSYYEMYITIFCMSVQFVISKVKI